MKGFGLSLRKGWPRGRSLAEILREKLDEERARGFTLYGPGRADMVLCSEKAGLASRGENKLLVAALQVAAERIFQKKTGRASALLVDDARSELDMESSNWMLDVICNTGCQVILTGLKAESAEGLRNSVRLAMFHVEQGQITNRSHCDPAS